MSDKNRISKSSLKEYVNLFNNEHNGDCFDRYFGKHLSLLRKKNCCRLIFAHINIKSIRNKFSLLGQGINGNIEVLTNIRN